MANYVRKLDGLLGNRYEMWKEVKIIQLKKFLLDIKQDYIIHSNQVAFWPIFP